MELKDYLKQMTSQSGSDLYFSTNAPASIKQHGRMVALGTKPLDAATIRQLAQSIMTAKQIQDFETTPEMNLALVEPDLGRFRVNLFKQQGETAIVIRHIQAEIPSGDSLGLPNTLMELVMEKRGLILLVGATGSGKSSSLAAMINHRNKHHAGHIITIEDPIEFVHPHQQSIVNQREVGSDTLSYEDALQNALRQAPDVILIGEIRSRETMEHAIAYAETGHLCLSSLHANNANQALDRIINFFPEERHKQLFLDLSLNLKGIVSQRLIPSCDNKRVAAVEILLGSPRVCDLILKGEVHELKEAMEKSVDQGMQTFDGALYELYRTGKISLEDAVKNADSQNNLRLKIQLAEKGQQAAADDDAPDIDTSGLSLKDDD